MGERLDKSDKKRVHDPAETAEVEEIRRYAEVRGVEVDEHEWDDNWINGGGRITVLWKDGFVNDIMYIGDSGEPLPPDAVKKLKRLHVITILDDARTDLSWLGTLEGLTTIRVTMPRKSEWFPTSWRCASTLQGLYLHYENPSISYLPDSIRRLNTLREIVLGNATDQLVTLLDWLGELPKLETLWLRGGFASIPYSLVKSGLPFKEGVPTGRGVWLEDVTLAEQDVSLFLGNDRTLIEAYYRDEQAGEDAALRECKVIFLGDGGAGKTSLIRRMKEHYFRSGEKTTEGVRIIPWDTELDGKPFRLRFMDFGGQEIMHSMHRCFLSDHTVYVVVCSVRDDVALDTVAVRWLEQIKSYAPDCPVILALNKADENPRICVDETALTDRYPKLKAVLKTSAAAEEGSAYYAGFLRDAIMEQCLPCVQDWRGSKAMLAVKRALETMQENYITAEKYRKLCADNGVTQTELQNALLGWFRDLGVAYFYRRKAYDRALESLQVLNPEWLTNGIYRLILRTDEQGKNGVLSHKDIRDILSKSFKGDASDTTYKPFETEFILHVMRVFQISHEIGEQGAELIPMLLPKKTPKGTGRFKKDALHLRWAGTFLPNNLIHRLMIQKYGELDQKCMWRTGARFNSPRGGCAALAELVDDKSLDVYVTGGSAAERRAYMQSFQDRAEEILRDLNLLNATEKYLCCVVNGKEGKIPYKTVIHSWEHGDETILIQDILEYARPEELLQTVDPDPAHWKRRIFPKSDGETEKKSAETWNLNLKNVLLIIAIVVFLAALAKGADILEILKLLPGLQ